MIAIPIDTSRTLSAWRNAIDFIEARGLADSAMSVYRTPGIENPTVLIQVNTLEDMERAFAGEGVVMRVFYHGGYTQAVLEFGPYEVRACEDGHGRAEGEYML